MYNATGIQNRRPNSLSRGSLNLNFKLFNQVNLPFEFILSTRRSEFRQPFNQFGVNPQIASWCTLHGGYFSTHISDLTFGDNRILGGGVELTPGKFHLRMLYGRSNKATKPQPGVSRLGRPDQYTYAGSFGYGNSHTNFISLNLIHVQDKKNAIGADSSFFNPRENLASSVSFGIAPIQAIRLSAEVGASAYSNDINADPLDKNYGVPKFLFTPRTSTQIDGAAIAHLLIQPADSWNFRINSRWIGPGYVSLGYQQMPSDLFEISGGPSLQLLGHRLRLQAKGSMSMNNLRHNKLAITHRYSGAFFADFQATNHLGFNVRYNNNQISTQLQQDSLSNHFLYNGVGISTRGNFSISGIRNAVNLTYNFKNSKNENSVRSATNKTKTNSINFTYSFFLQPGWQFSTNTFYSSSKLSPLNTTIVNVSETILKRWLENKFNTAITGGYSTASTAENSNKNILMQLTASYSFKAYGRLSASVSNKYYQSNRVNTTHYSELYGSLDYSLTF